MQACSKMIQCTRSPELIPQVDASMQQNDTMEPSSTRSPELIPQVDASMQQNDTMDSIAEPRALAEQAHMSTVTFEYHITNQGKRKLVDSNGFSYNVKRQRPNATDWQCIVRPKKNPCRAMVIERTTGIFVISSRSHNHDAAVGAQLSTKIKTRLKEEAASNIFKPAPAIVNEVLLQELTDAPCPSLAQPEHLARTANRFCQKLRPADPKDLDFELEVNHIPDNFLRGDI